LKYKPLSQVFQKNPNVCKLLSEVAIKVFLKIFLKRWMNKLINYL